MKLADNYFINSMMVIEGMFLSIKKLHWFASDMNMHLLTDEFLGDLKEFLDKMMENYIALNPNVNLNLEAVLDDMKINKDSFLHLLRSLRVICINILNSDNVKDDEHYSGIKTYLEDFFGKINEYIYKVNIINGVKKEIESL